MSSIRAVHSAAPLFLVVGYGCDSCCGGQAHWGMRSRAGPLRRRCEAGLMGKEAPAEEMRCTCAMPMHEPRRLGMKRKQRRKKRRKSKKN